MRHTIILSILCFANSLFAQPIIVGHRGASYLAPENTVASAELAWELGADGVEIDIYLTFDKRIMVLHDRNTGRVAADGRSMNISESFSADLRSLDVGSWKGEKYRGEKIPFLSEILNSVPKDKILVVEIKSGSEIVPYLKQEFESCGRLDQAVFICFGWEAITATKKMFPDNPCYWLSSSRKDVMKRLDDVVEAGLDGVNLRYNIIDEEVIREAHERGLEVWTWTVNDPVVARKLSDMGVVSITTDRPGWLRDELEKM